MDRTSEARRTAGSVVLVALLLVALATLAVGPSTSVAGRTAVRGAGQHATRALEALRAVSIPVLHRATRSDRTPLRAAASSVAALTMVLIAVRSRFRRHPADAGSGAPRWWGGRCWRAPPLTATA